VKFDHERQRLYGLVDAWIQGQEEAHERIEELHGGEAEGERVNNAMLLVIVDADLVEDEKRAHRCSTICESSNRHVQLGILEWAKQVT
jgi:hypothetical protein